MEVKGENMLKKFKKLKVHHQILFAIIIGFAVISFWRGVWGLLDEYLFPNDYRFSLVVSLVMGIVILLLTHYVTEELM